MAIMTGKIEASTMLEFFKASIEVASAHYSVRACVNVVGTNAYKNNLDHVLTSIGFLEVIARWNQRVAAFYGKTREVDAN